MCSTHQLSADQWEQDRPEYVDLRMSTTEIAPEAEGGEGIANSIHLRGCSTAILVYRAIDPILKQEA